MATQYNINPNIHGQNGFGLPFCEDTYTARLAATTDTSLTVPGIAANGMPCATVNNKFIAVFSYEPNNIVWVAVNATAAAPAGAGFAASTSELNPSAKLVKAGDVIHMFAVTADTDVSVALYPVQA